jgi:hypothetical protein
VTDRRAGAKQGPYVAKQPRSRNKDGSWRKKRTDTGIKRKSSRTGRSGRWRAGRDNAVRG